MKVVVTGASGHVGANLVPALIAAGHEVRAVYHSHLPEHRCGADWVRADLADPPSLVAAFAGAEAVIHLAALISILGDPSGHVARTNIEGTASVIAACRTAGVRRLVHFGSVHALHYGRDATVDESTPPAGAVRPAYDRSKAAGAALVTAAADEILATIVLMPTGVLGPDDWRGSRTNQTLRLLLTGRMPVLIDGGFDWVDVRDVAAGGVAALTRGGSGERYLLSGHYASIAELARLCGFVTGRRRRLPVMSLGVARALLPLVRASDRFARREPLMTAEALTTLAEGPRHCSNAKAARELGFHSRPLEVTVRDTWTWLWQVGQA